MPTCAVPNCRTRGKNGPRGLLGSLFRVPKEPELLEEWRRQIPRQDRPLKPKVDHVCEKHFAPHQIIRSFDFKIGGKIESVPRDRIMLKKGAVPSLLTHIPKRRKPGRFYIESKPSEPKSEKCHDIGDSIAESNDENLVEPKLEQNPCLFIEEIIDEPIGESYDDLPPLVPIETKNDWHEDIPPLVTIGGRNHWNEKIPPPLVPIETKNGWSENISVLASFETKINEISSELPPKWYFHYISDEDAVIFLNIGKGCSIEKRIIVFNEMVNEPLEYKVKVFVRDTEIEANLPSLRNIEDISTFIFLCDSLEPCEKRTS